MTNERHCNIERVQRVSLLIKKMGCAQQKLVNCWKIVTEYHKGHSDFSVTIGGKKICVGSGPGVHLPSANAIALAAASSKESIPALVKNLV